MKRIKTPSLFGSFPMALIILAMLLLAAAIVGMAMIEDGTEERIQFTMGAGLIETRCIDGYRFVIGGQGHIQQVLDGQGHGVKCGGSDGN